MLLGRSYVLGPIPYLVDLSYREETAPVRIVATPQPPPSTPIRDGFHVMGLSLPASIRQRLAAAFPYAVFYTAGNDLPERTQSLCDLLGRVVLFTYIPAMLDRRWVRASAVFHLDTVKVVGVHPHCTDTLFDRAFEAEFAGVIEADAPSTAFLRAALSVQQGELWFPRGYLSQCARRSVASPSPTNLSVREAELLDLLASGLTNQAIADKLFITRDTVRWHLRSIYTKLGVSNRDAALRLARNNLAREPQRHSA